MKKVKDYKSSKRVVEVNDLSFLRERNHRYGWVKRHYKHFRLRRALRRARAVVAADPDVAFEIRHYYFIPQERITVRQNPK